VVSKAGGAATLLCSRILVGKGALLLPSKYFKLGGSCQDFSEKNCWRKELISDLLSNLKNNS